MKVGLLRGCCTGAAWLSSVRAVRCLVKSTNERNPYGPLPTGNAGNSGHTARLRGRKVGMTSSQYGPYIQGCTRATMACTEGREAARRSQPQRACLSSDRGLQPDPVKSDLLVTAYQLRRRECVPGPCTHRPSHHPSRLHPKPPAEPLGGGGVEGVEGEGGEVVTR